MYKEAIKIINKEYECVKRAIAGCNRDCSNCDLVELDKKIFDAYDLAIATLQKQIPQKPTVNLWEEWCECPICESPVTFEDIKYQYCPDCGQRIDWSKEE